MTHLRERRTKGYKNPNKALGGTKNQLRKK